MQFYFLDFLPVIRLPALPTPISWAISSRVNACSPDQNVNKRSKNKCKSNHEFPVQELNRQIKCRLNYFATLKEFKNKATKFTSLVLQSSRSLRERRRKINRIKRRKARRTERETYFRRIHCGDRRSQENLVSREKSRGIKLWRISVTPAT